MPVLSEKTKKSIASAELLHPNRTAVAQKTCTHVINALIQKMKSVDNLELITYTFYIFQLDYIVDRCYQLKKRKLLIEDFNFCLESGVNVRKTSALI